MSTDKEKMIGHFDHGIISQETIMKEFDIDLDGELERQQLELKEYRKKYRLYYLLCELTAEKHVQTVSLLWATDMGKTSINTLITATAPSPKFNYRAGK